MQNKFNATVNKEKTEIKVKFQTGYYPLPVGLENYYTKNETYSQTEITNFLNNKQNNLGYTPENSANKSDSYIASSSTTYASTKALVDGLSTKLDKGNYTGTAYDLYTNDQNFLQSLQNEQSARYSADQVLENSKQNKLESVSGNTGIGKTDVSATEKLDVNGNVKATGFKTPTGTATQALTANGGVFDLTTKLDKGIYIGTAQDLKNEIDGKANTSHTHNISDVTNLQTALDSKENISNKQNNLNADATNTKYPTVTAVNSGLAAKLDKGTYTGTASDLKSLIDTKADLVGGKIPASQLPAYVDDVLEFANLASFPATGENGKIYIAIDTNITYRWTGTGYAEISASLALGETSSTAYRGDRGKIAYDHSQTIGNPHGTTKNDIGLGNVPNLDTTNAVNNSHTHSNKSILDLITEPFTTSLKSLYDGAVTSINNLLLTGQRLITSGEITKLSNTSGTNTGDETTSSIQTKRPLKTIEGQSLEGSGNIDLTKNDVGLGNVDNTSDLDKPISTATQQALNNKLDKDSFYAYGEVYYAYGVRIDNAVSNPAMTRIGNPVLHQSLPIQSLMRRCLLKADGTVNYYLDANDSTLKEDGTAAVLDGTDGDVMVEIPQFYYRVDVVSGTASELWISQTNLPGFQLSEKCYISAYEATVDRTIPATPKLASVVNTTAAFRGGDNNAAWDAESRTLLGRPASWISRTNARTYARNKGAVGKNGAGWNQLTYNAYKALFWLYFVEYANKNSQAPFNSALDANGFRQGGLGAGVTDLDGGKWGTFNSRNPFVPMGFTNSLGNKTGVVAYTMPAEYDSVPFTTYVPSYRGVENPFGHIWQWVDGINVKAQAADAGGRTVYFATDNPSLFQDSNYNGFREIGDSPRADGHVKSLILGQFADFLPKELGAGTTTYWTDYYSQNIPSTGEVLRGLIVGGGAAWRGASAGLACSDTNNAPSAIDGACGTRLVFHP